ncbi:hypothetical protein BS50DRAFT_664830, partial [Corynespora cassiicola Philippines]
TPSSTDSAQTPHSDSIIESPGDIVLNISQLRLLHHFTTTTAITFTFKPGAEEVYSMNMVQTSFNFPFLLHAILALAALHLSRLDPPLRTQYLHQAEQHHNAALYQFRVQISEIDEKNRRAVLFFTFALFPYLCSLPVEINNGIEHTLNSILSSFMLTRRVRPMVDTVYQDMLDSDIGLIVPQDIRDKKWNTTESLAETELVTLRKFSELIHRLYPLDVTEAYRGAIHKLELVFKAAEDSQRPPSDSLLKLWIHLVSDKFMDLLLERQPGALLILGYYAVFLFRGQHYWFLQGVGEQILDVVEALIPTEWMNWLDWPKKQIRR